MNRKEMTNKLKMLTKESCHVINKLENRVEWL